MMPLRGSTMMPFTQAAPSTGPIPPPILHTMSTTAGVTQGFPRIGVDLTASRPPPPRFPASGLEPWEGETARKEDKGDAISTHPVWLDEFTKGGEKKKHNQLETMWERQRQLGPAIQAWGCLSGNRPAAHPATTLSAYIMSQVQYSHGRLFKVRLSMLTKRW